jgi:hypothetical protein
MTGRVFFFAVIEATNPPFFLEETAVDFLSDFILCESGEGGCTTT